MDHRARVIAVAALLSVVALVVGAALAIATGQVILFVFGVIVALAPWGAIVDQVEKAERDRRER